MIDITMEDHWEGAENNEPLGNKGIVMPAGTKNFVKDLREAWLGVPRGAVFDHLAHLPQRYPLFHRIDLAGIRLTE